MNATIVVAAVATLLAFSTTANAHPNGHEATMTEEEQNREVYAHAGLALQMAQILEHAIVSSMIVLDLVPRSKGKVVTVDEWYQRHDAYQEMQFEKTLGRLVGAVREVATMNDQLVADLQQCTRKRNYLAHHFFRVQAEAFMNEPGRRKMISELNDIQALFERTIGAFEAAVQPAWARYGFTEDRREELVAEYMREFSGKQADGPKERKR